MIRPDWRYWLHFAAGFACAGWWLVVEVMR
jgi:hypothetical protein